MTQSQHDSHEALAAAREETRHAFESRALIYAHFYDVLEEEYGPVRATELMKRAIYRRGLEIAEKYRACVAAGDLEAIGQLFVEDSACGGELFAPRIEDLDPAEGRIVLRMDACPLKDAWLGAGLSPERVDHLCEIAAAVDRGTFEGAGCRIQFLDRQPRLGGSGRCLLEITLSE